LINEINNKYDLDDFYDLELIIEKLLWNLKNKLNYLYQDEQNCINQIFSLDEKGLESCLNKFYDDNSYRSFINKLILMSDTNNKIYHRNMEGSNDIFNKNDLNLRTWYSLKDKTTYESVITDPKKVKTINVPSLYYTLDYGFPNLNFGKPFIQSGGFRRNKIKKMFYDNDSEKNWFKLIKK